MRNSALPVGYPEWLGTVDSIHAAAIRRLFVQESQRQHQRALAKARAMAKYVPALAPQSPRSITDGPKAPPSKC